MGKVVFLLLALPLGICYFTLTVVGISLGTGTLVIWIGLPILFVTLLIVRGMAEIERRLVSNLLHIPLLYQLPEQNEPHVSFLRRFGRILTDPYTWTSMVYMLIKLPLGIFSFTLTVTLSAVSIALTLFPLGYLINLLVNIILLKNGVSSDGNMIPGFIEVHGYFDSVMFARSFLGV
ncbi:MAG: sensor domain-containing protein, partial [Ktedonobacteraceae bacterium]